MGRFCPAPWIHVATTPRGKPRICCDINAVGPSYDLTGPIPQEYIDKYKKLFNNNVEPKPCQQCWTKEDIGIKSKREYFIDQWHDWGLELSTIPLSYDIRFGTTCNAKCVMCSPFVSSKWAEDKDVNAIYHPDFKATRDWFTPETTLWKQIMNTAEQVKLINIAGGEPMYAKFFVPFLEELKENNYQGIIQLTTNLSIASKKVLDALAPFKTLLTCSVDGTGAVFNYIRYPLDYNTFKENVDIIKTYSNINYKFSFTMQNLNALHIVETMDDLAGEQVDIEFVERPLFLQPGVLPDDAKEEALERIDGSNYDLDSAKELIQKPLWHDYGDQFLSYINAIDKQRGLNSKEIFSCIPKTQKL